ncbi:MAG: sulfur transferase domain-containing protein [Myxococcota bacterium]
MKLKYAGALAAICVVLIVTLAPILGQNFHPVVDGKIYRSAQLDAEDLESRAAEFGLASVVAVRPARPNKEWYTAEQSGTKKLGLSLVNVGLNADRMPSRQLLKALVGALDSAPRPMLLHCRAGVERSGLAAAVALLLDGESVESARGQFSLRYGFHPWLSQSDLPRVLDRYEEWLSAAGIESSAEVFRNWVDETYVAAFYKADLEIVEFSSDARAGRPVAFSLRVTNRSPDTQRFRATHDFGVHVGTLIEGITAPEYRHAARSGKQDLDVAPGASHVFDIELAALPSSGIYRLTVDLVDESVAWFSDMGSTVLVREFEVGPPRAVAAGP